MAGAFQANAFQASPAFQTGTITVQQPAGAPSRRRVIVRGKHYHVTPAELSELLYWADQPDETPSEAAQDAPRAVISPKAPATSQKAQESTLALLAELSAFGQIADGLQAVDALNAEYIAQVGRQLRLAEESAVITQLMLELA